MTNRKRAAKPIDIALTEEQIEGIIAEAASRTRGSSSSRSLTAPQGHTWVGSEETPAVTLVQGTRGFLPLADVPLPSHAFLPGIAAEEEPGTSDPRTIDTGSVRESLEVEEHRRNVLRQLRGR
jgi:hypothetical protein